MKETVIPPGISFLVCCHNSATRLTTTLHHIISQEFSKEVEWEVLIVDNASTDDTSNIALQIWKDSGLAAERFRIVLENQLGIGIARYTGIREAKYEFICFIDDDNWVDKDYFRVAHEIMTKNPDVAACGSLNTATADQELPDWFEANQRSFAVGPQSEEAGDVTDKRGVLWSAGIVLRKTAIDDLLDAGFSPMVTGAQGGESLLRSEDYELCLALKLRGWKIWYEPELKLQHYMPKQRLDWMYLRRLLRGVGESDTGLLPYFYAQDRNYKPRKVLWSRLLLKTLKYLIPKAHKLFLLRFRRFEGDADILQIERSAGFISSLIRQNNKFDQLTKRIINSDWIKH